MRLIDAEALTQSISKGLVGLRAYEGRRMVEIVADCIVNAPTAEAKPVVHAHWDIEYDDDDNIKKCYCSNCGVGCKPMNYCGFCGAQMDEPFSQTHENGVKIPVMSMKDICRKIMCDR